MTGLRSPSGGLQSPGGKKTGDDDIIMEEREVARHGRVYKKSNWTLTELQVLQTAKREDQERQLKADPKEKHKSAAERWQWIEDYCWEQRVERSAQQCRDRWERMSADFKKVGDFEKQLPRGAVTYWQLTVEDRKSKKLPSNFQQEVYQALGGWFVRSRAVDPNDIVIDTSVPSPLHVNNTGASPPSNGENSFSEEADSDPEEIPTIGKKRKLPVGFNAELIAAVIERANEATQKTMLECEDRKDRRHKETLEANQRMADGYIAALENIAGALRDFGTRRDDKV